MLIFEKVYDGESLVDVERDVWEALDGDFTPELNSIPTDMHGFPTGTFKVSITWKNDEI